ncbi:hypothetical protein K474DRAFT_1366311 [Panus rudis PR-1116 ss-1]|nr:hypothetical protein K474DRAFT_1366311 [Panus rudis PR-1116 ss-1]
MSRQFVIMDFGLHGRILHMPSFGNEFTPAKNSPHIVPRSITLHTCAPRTMYTPPTTYTLPTTHTPPTHTPPTIYSRRRAMCSPPTTKAVSSRKRKVRFDLPPEGASSEGDAQATNGRKRRKTSVDVEQKEVAVAEKVVVAEQNVAVNEAAAANEVAVAEEVAVAAEEVAVVDQVATTQAIVPRVAPMEYMHYPAELQYYQEVHPRHLNQEDVESARPGRVDPADFMFEAGFSAVSAAATEDYTPLGPLLMLSDDRQTDIYHGIQGSTSGYSAPNDLDLAAVFDPARFIFGAGFGAPSAAATED